MAEGTQLTLDARGIAAIAGCYAIMRGWALEKKTTDRGDFAELARPVGDDPDQRPDHPKYIGLAELVQGGPDEPVT